MNEFVIRRLFLVIRLKGIPPFIPTPLQYVVMFVGKTAVQCESPAARTLHFRPRVAPHLQNRMGVELARPPIQTSEHFEAPH